MRYLHKSFGFDGDLFILHGVFFLHRPYLRAQISHFLELRRELKLQNTLVSMAKANFLKLLLNGVYGYCLARINSPSSPFSCEIKVGLRGVRQMLDRHPETILRINKISSSYAVVTSRCYDSESSVSSLDRSWRNNSGNLQGDLVGEYDVLVTLPRSSDGRASVL